MDDLGPILPDPFRHLAMPVSDDNFYIEAFQLLTASFPALQLHSIASPSLVTLKDTFNTRHETKIIGKSLCRI